MSTAIITGITGQDGAYLAKLLLEKGYKVVGAARRSASQNLWRLRELGIESDVEMAEFDLFEYGNIHRLIDRVRPSEIYNLAAQSFVGTSFEQPIYTSEIDALGPLRILEALRAIGAPIKFYQASTSEMFGKVQATPQTETTPFYPRSPYGVSKLYAHWITVNYRESYGIHACSGILFNHESPLRGQDFVTRKITLGLSHIVNGSGEVLQLGNLAARRDWGFAGDYVEGIWKMLQAEKASDYVLATGQTHAVQKFVEAAAGALGMDLIWEGEGVKQRGFDRRSNKVVVEVNPKFFRPAEVDVLLGSFEKAKADLGWQPSVTFEGLAAMMSRADYDRVKANRVLG
jgi:GDPmannose 4,6-dehydratase